MFNTILIFKISYLVVTWKLNSTYIFWQFYSQDGQTKIFFAIFGAVTNKNESWVNNFNYNFL